MTYHKLPTLSPFLLAMLLVAGLWLAVGQAPAVQAADADIRINELMSSNTTTLQDEDGAYSDWIELYNDGPDSVSLAGWYLTDDATNLTKWQLPAVTLNSNGYLVVFASSKDRRVAGSELHTNFALSASGEYLALVQPDALTITDEYTPTFPALADDQAYGVVMLGVRDFLTAPTPGGTNDAAVPLVAISVPSTVFTSAFTVALSSPYLLPGDGIRYTTNGTEPTAASPLYTVPINITGSTRLRARIVRGAWLGQTSYAAYIQVDAAVASVESTLPLVIIEAFNQSISTGAGSTQVIAAIIDVGTGPLVDRARVIDMPNYAGFVGMRRRGSSSGGFPKRQFSFDLWSDYSAQEIEASLLGMPSESDWILYAPGRYERNMISNNFAHQLAKDMGMYGARTQFVEVYLNDNYNTSSPANSNTALIDASDYDGIYVLMENMKRGTDRVDVTKLEPTDNADPEITGGYIWTIDRSDFNEYAFRLTDYNNYPANENGGTSSWINITYPKNDQLTLDQRTYFVNYITEFAAAMTGPNAHDPVEGYHKYIDVDSWIDGYLLDVFVKDPDALRLSHFFSKPRYGKLYNDIAWDYDRTMGSIDGRDLNPCTTISYVPTFNTGGDNANLFNYWEQLLEDVDFYVRFADRWYDLRLNGPLNTAYMYPLVDNLSGQITPDMYAREIARWDTPNNNNYGPRNTNPNVCGFSMTLDTYDKEVQFFKWWLNQRMVWIDDTHINLHPPTVSAVGTTAVITPAPSAPPASTLYFTLDGTDPRLPGGALSPNAIAYTGPASLSQSTWVYARTYDPTQVNIDRRWSALGKAYHQASPAADFTNLALSEINYNPADDPDNDFEYLELTNTSPVRIDISGVQIRTAISHTFGVGHLDPGETIIVAKDFNAFQYRYDTPTSPWYHASIRYEQWVSGSLSNEGELIELFAADNTPILALSYSPSGAWPARANGRGSALELGDPTAVPTATLEVKNSYLADSDNWRPTSEYHGSPGRAGLGPDGRVLFNELLTHTDWPQTDAIELFNTTAAPLNLSHWFLSDSGQEYKKFQIADGTIIGAGGFITFDETDFNSGNPNNPIPFALSSAEGETVYLLEADSDGHLLRFADEVKFGPTANGVSLGRSPDGQGDFVRLCALTLGAPNAPYCYGPVLLNEIQYNPAGPDANLEYIELYNKGNAVESLANWQLRGEVNVNFGIGDTIAPGQYLLLVGFNPNDTTLRDAFLTTYNLTPGSVTLMGPWTGGQLSNGGARITLLRPDSWQALPAPGFYPMLVEDEVIYDDENGWPMEPDGTGPSLELRSNTLDNRLPSSWMASYAPNGTPGRHNDDDNPIINSGANFLVTEGDSGTTLATFTVTLTYRSGMTVTVNYATQNGTAVAGTDYFATSGTLTFPPESTSQPITVPIIGNERYEAPRSFSVVLSNPVRGRMGTAATTITIVENDPLPTLTLAAFSVGEGVGTAVFTATLSHPSAFPVTVNYATADGTATAGTDYTATSGTLTFPADNTSQPILVSIADDTIDEPDETLVINLSNIGNAFLGNSQATMTILDNDDPPVISATPLTVTEGLSGTWMLALSHPSVHTITLEVATADGTALAGVDYQPISGTVSFAPLQTSHPITLTTLDNSVQDGNKALTLELANPTHATLGQTSVEATIVDDEGHPVLTAANQFVVEGAEGETTYAPITLTLSHPSVVTTTVDVATEDDTAVGGLDYQPISGTVTFAPLQTTAVISVPVFGNDVDDPHRTLTVTLTNPVGLELGTTAVQLTILNDDGASSLAVSDVTVNEGDGLATFHFLLVPASGQMVQVDVATADGTATASTDYTPLSTTLSFDPGQTTAELHVSITDDALYELDETFFLFLSNPIHVDLANSTVEATIVDNDPLPSLSAVGEAVWEGEMATFTVTLSAASGHTTTVAVATADGSATAGADYEPITGTVTFAPGETSQLVQVAVLADGLYESSETVYLLLSDPSHALLATAEAAATIVNTDPPPVINVAGGQIGAGQMAYFTVTLSAPSGITATADYATVDGTAVAGIDYVATAGTLTFAPGQTVQLVEVDLLNLPDRARRLRANLTFGLVLSNLGELEPGTITAEIIIVESSAGYAIFLPLIVK